VPPCLNGIAAYGVCNSLPPHLRHDMNFARFQYKPVAGLKNFRGGDSENLTRTEGFWAYGRILCMCELGHAGADTGVTRPKWALREQN